MKHEFSYLLRYSIPHSWGNKESVTIASICLHTSRSCPSLLLLLIFPMQNNKSVKAPFTPDVRKIIILRVGCHVKYSTPLCLVLFLTLNPTPETVFPCITHNGALMYT